LSERSWRKLRSETSEIAAKTRPGRRNMGGGSMPGDPGIGRGTVAK
jgi:hypothetical protein